MSTCTIPLGAQEDHLRKIIGSGWPETLTRPLPEGEENTRGVLVNQGGLPTQVTTRGRGVLLFYRGGLATDLRLGLGTGDVNRNRVN